MTQHSGILQPGRLRQPGFPQLSLQPIVSPVSLTQIEVDYMIAVTKGDRYECKRGTQANLISIGALTLARFALSDRLIWPRTHSIPAEAQ